MTITLSQFGDLAPSVLITLIVATAVIIIVSLLLLALFPDLVSALIKLLNAIYGDKTGRSRKK